MALGMAHPYFEMHQSEQGAWLCLRLAGELDLAVAPALEDRLNRLRAAERPVRLDLSALQFIDSSGIQVLVGAAGAARSNGWQFRIDPNIAPAVERVLRLIHVYGLLVEERSPEPTSS